MRHHAKADSQRTTDNLKVNYKSVDKAVFVTFGALLFATATSGLALSSLGASATQTCTTDSTTGVYSCTTTDSDTITATANASVTVASACTISDTPDTDTAHTATVSNNVHTENIGTTTIKTICNDGSGFAVYAVGFSGDSTSGTNTDLIYSGNTDYNIHTGTYSAGSSTSSWGMKLAKVAGSYAPIIVGSSEDTDTGSTTNYSNYAAVPSSYTKVVYREAQTDATAGSSFTTTYDFYAAGSQPAGTYTGKVKYTMVHPNGTSAPTA